MKILKSPIITSMFTETAYRKG